jgi:hypothetical protein
VDLEDAVVGQASGFRAGPSALSQKVTEQSVATDAFMLTLRQRVFARPDLGARALAVAAQDAVTASTTAARAYATTAQEAFTLGLYGPTTQQDLIALTPLVQAGLRAVRLVGSAADIQDTIIGSEVMLYAATQLDAAIRAAQPIPITSIVRQQPGQSIYSFAQQHYSQSGKTPAQMRDLVGLILRLNKNIRTPSLIPDGTRVVRPVA